SFVGGAAQWIVYGVTGPWMEATRIWLAGSALSPLIICPKVSTGVSIPPASADTQPSSVTVAARLVGSGDSRGGFAAGLPQRWPNSLQRKFPGGPTWDARLVFELVSKSRAAFCGAAE